MGRRVVIGEIKHETNTFMPIGTDLECFQKRCLLYGNEVLTRLTGTHTSIGGYIDAAAKAGIEIIPALTADATPAGKVNDATFEHLINSLLATIKNALELPGGLDGIALSLHGAMVVESIDDGEGEILERIKKLVGPNIPVVCTLDLHANVTEKMINNADCFFGYDTNPHVDMYERAQEAFQALLDIWSGALQPVMQMIKTDILAPTINMRTVEGPMVELFTKAYEHEKKKEVRNVSVFGGFPFADVEFSGLSVVTITNNCHDLAQQICADITSFAWKIRKRFIKELWEPREAVRYAMQASKGPIILADVADNLGGGGSGDTTTLLEELLKLGADNVGFALIVDPETVKKAIEAGPGAKIAISLGGKVCADYGNPISSEGTVQAITDGIFFNKGPMQTGIKINLGRTARILVGGVEVIVVENRVAPNDPEIFHHVGIEPAEKQILVLKSRGHFRAAYEAIAAEFLEVDCPGYASPNLNHFQYKKVRRPIFPLDIE